MDRTEAIQRSAAHDETAHQTGADQQVRVQTHDTLRQSKVFLLLPDQLVGDHDTTSVDGKASKGDVRTIGNRPNDVGNCLYFVGHSANLILLKKWTRLSKVNAELQAGFAAFANAG
jgi:hypothetical protein